MKILVTGVAGFVGSAIARRAIAEGHEVVGVDSITDYYDVSIKQRNLASLAEGSFTFVQDDLNTMDLDHLLKGINYIFHEAGQPGVRKSWGKDFATYVDENVNGTQKLLEAARSSSTLKKVVYASSSSVYGDAEQYPTDELLTPRPVSPYGVTKLAAEHLCRLYATNFGVPTISLRYFTVYGPGQRPDMAFTRFVRAAVLGSEIEIYGSGEQIRDFTYVDDVVGANFAAAFSDVEPGSVYNVAGGSNISVNDVLRMLERMHGAPLNVRYVQAVDGDVIRTGGSIAAIERDLGWSPEVNIEEGLRRHYEWAKQTFGAESA